MSLTPPDEEPRDLSIPEEWKAGDPALEPVLPETHFVKGRLIAVVGPDDEKPDLCVHMRPLARGYWCGECQDESGRRQAQADKTLRERRLAERRAREL